MHAWSSVVGWLSKIIVGLISCLLVGFVLSASPARAAEPRGGVPASPVSGIGVSPPMLDDSFVSNFGEPLGEMADEEGPTRYYPDGNGRIPIGDPFEYPRIPALDNDNPNSLWYTYRPNLFNMDVTDEWDFYNLINTDRPDFTDVTYSVGRGVTIIENGYTFRKIQADNISLSKRRLPETLVRYGVNDEFELRVKWNGYLANSVADANTGIRTDLFGTDDLIVGFKYEIWQQDRWLPMLTVVASSTLPTGTRGFSADQMQPEINLVYGWGLRRWLYLKMSTTVDFLRNNDPVAVLPGAPAANPLVVTQVDNTTEWHQSTSLLFQLTKRVGGFTEWFCAFQNNGADNRPSHFVDAGTYIYLTPNLQFDARIGTRLSDRVDHVFTGAGLSLRF